jgi:hypothetical protein
MGEVIAFEPNIVGARMKPWPGDLAKIVVFTGVWHEPMNDRGGKKKRAPSLGKSSAARAQCKTPRRGSRFR